MKLILVGLVLGLAGGLPGGWFALQELGPQLGFDGTSEVQYTVEARRVEDGRVQLMLRSDEDETVLATFTERPDDVAALARVGDAVVLQISEPAPIIDEPHVLRVITEADDERPDPFDPNAAVDADEEDVEDADEEEADEEDGDEADEHADEAEEADAGEHDAEEAGDDAEGADAEAEADAPDQS